jgi:hypothetical protein
LSNRKCFAVSENRAFFTCAAPILADVECNHVGIPILILAFLIFKNVAIQVNSTLVLDEDVC